jgi:hypothetical protein
MILGTEVPSDSAVHALCAKANYRDAYSIATPADCLTALHAYLTVTARTPGWIDFLMRMRNRLVRLLRLKDVGELRGVPGVARADSLGPGDRVGIFTIRAVCDKEVVLEILDSHLDVVVSVYRSEGAASRLTLSTLVFYHNWIGRLYMVPVGPMHRIVVRSILGKALQPASVR